MDLSFIHQHNQEVLSSDDEYGEEVLAMLDKDNEICLKEYLSHLTLRPMIKGDKNDFVQSVL